ncbi:unnamed protein product, partial [Discosporangium mesarthrocarpum]
MSPDCPPGALGKVNAKSIHTMVFTIRRKFWVSWTFGLWKPVACLLAISCCVYLTYRPLFRSTSQVNWRFLTHWDDWHNFQTPEAKHLLSKPWKSVMPGSALINVYEPTSWTAKAVVVVGLILGGIDPDSPEASLWYRRVSLSLHLVNCVLLLMICGELLQHAKHSISMPQSQPEEERERWTRWASCVLPVCAFAVHPINVEVVCWPSCLPYTLCLFFCLASLAVQLKSEAYQGTTRGQGLCRALSVVSSSLYVAAVSSKAAALLWPMAVALTDAIAVPPEAHGVSGEPGSERRQGRKGAPNALVGRGALFYMVKRAVMYGVPALVLGWAAVGANRDGEGDDTDVISLRGGERLVKAAVTMWFYMGKMVWPSGLRPHYALDPKSLSIDPALHLDSYLSMVMVLGLTSAGLVVLLGLTLDHIMASVSSSGVPMAISSGICSSDIASSSTGVHGGREQVGAGGRDQTATVESRTTKG